MRRGARCDQTEGSSVSVREIARRWMLRRRQFARRSARRGGGSDLAAAGGDDGYGAGSAAVANAGTKLDTAP